MVKSSEQTPIRLTPKQLDRAISLHLDGAPARRIAKDLGLSYPQGRTVANWCRKWERHRDHQLQRIERNERFLSTQRSFAALERGRAPGGRETRGGVASADQAPTPNSMRLYPFLAILTEQPREFVSERLPMSQWTEG